ncbi:maleylpyruvate isomerase family mycothiol-dependent enzyme [Paenarthrobacter sp. Z7-10]|uniref:maleylpyruvate isomerase family mycothiol-dependent enzyme n=1 Tax=Paenarthrobacter sp. Z7-10 TaxID=2787635 RepID=UPI0022A99259|nr:maleylpyruvate isomerase family mycothiol-dependent enzyme [Paenarthrobacter sp. Z7-10]MCZ2404618.1 maleylpyruvate isomerase family mycothiol-dependent enzyme [Paenarthrobacter sp. Z7-10]
MPRRPGWSVRDVAAHLLMPYELSVPGFVVRLIAARFNFDRLADRWARRDRRTGQELITSLAATTSVKFNVPGAGETAPLCHLLAHGEDIRRPLGIRTETNAESANAALPELARFAKSGLVDGLQFRSTDTGWSSGGGLPVAGTASALIVTLSGRSAAIDELTGEGVEKLRSRLSRESAT